jgi:hypothetical protein
VATTTTTTTTMLHCLPDASFIVGAIVLHLLTTVQAQGPIAENDLDGFVKPVIVCGPTILAYNKSSFFEQKVLNTDADPSKKVVYYSTYESFEPRMRFGPLYAADAVSYAVACSADVAKGTVGHVIWKTNVSSLPDGHKDGHGRGLTLLPNASALVAFERANYNKTGLLSGFFLSSNLAFLDPKNGKVIARQPLNTTNASKLFGVETNIMVTANKQIVFKAYPWPSSPAQAVVNPNYTIWPGRVPLPSYTPYNSPLGSDKDSAASSQSSIVYDTFDAEMGRAKNTLTPGDEGAPGTLTVFALDTITGQLTAKVNLSYYLPYDRSMSVDELSGNVFVIGRKLASMLAVTKLPPKADSITWSQNYSFQFLDANTSFNVGSICGSAHVPESNRLVIAFVFQYPNRYGPTSGNAAANKTSVRNSRVQVSHQTLSGASQRVAADPIPETESQQSHGVNTEDILVLIIDRSNGDLINARVVGTPFADICKSIEYAGDGVLALFGLFPTVYTSSIFADKQPKDYPVLFDTTDAGNAIGGHFNMNNYTNEHKPGNESEAESVYHECS